MLFQCTKKVLDKMSFLDLEILTPSQREEVYDPFYAWHVNLIQIGHMKALVFMNDLTKFPVIIYRPKKNDYKVLGKLFKDALKKSLKQIDVKEDCIESYISHIDTFQYAKTNGRKMVAGLNEICRGVAWFYDLLDENVKPQPVVSSIISDLLYRYEDGHDEPKSRMYQALCQMKGYDINDLDRVRDLVNYIFMIRLSVEEDIYRRVQVPANLTFYELHQIIQIIFEWDNYHMHDFKFYTKPFSKMSSYRSFYNNIGIVITNDMGDLWYDSGISQKNEYRTRLKDVFTKHGECIYTYDFGDDWKHRIKKEKTIKTKGSRYPILLEQVGNPAIEDSGGSVPIYIDDPEYQEWYEKNKKECTDIAHLNEKLRRIHV